MSDCIFCQLATNKEAIIAENKLTYAIKDIAPQAPIHLLLIPKEHTRSLNTVETQGKTLNSIIELAKTIATQYNIPGYKIVCNVESAGGQEVMHLHFHMFANSSERSIA